MDQNQMKTIAEQIAKSLEDTVPSAVEAVVETKLKELNLSDNTDIKEIKDQIKSLVELSKFAQNEQNLEETKKSFVEALVALRS